jgi:hypothetical protein
MGIDLVFAFFAGLVAYEIGLILILIVGFGFALNRETSVGILVVLVIMFTFNWTGTGSLYSILTVWEALYGFVVWLALGLFWSRFKWGDLVDRVIEYAKTASYIKTKDDVKNEIARRKSYDTIAFWILLWPFSVAGFFLTDFIDRVWKQLVDRLYKIYDRIADRKIEASGSFADADID